jgi:LDH2 family malate/lactate/ureidoglycolate dehydrogenase
MADTDTAVTVSVDSLTAFIVSVLEALKMSPRNAALTGDLMVRTDLRGVDSHGIGMLPRHVEWTRAGFVHPWAEPQVARDDLATGLVDGQKGLGHPPSAMAMALAITKAATYGMGVVAVRNSAMDDMLQALNETPRADGQERVYTAGEPEAETERQRRGHGIPVAPALVRQCNQIASELGVTRLG